MYFWKIDALKRELRAGTTPAGAALGYLLATLILYTSTAVPFAASEDGGWLNYVVEIGALCLGSWLAYRVNGGSRGVDFLLRYLALAWVLTVRFIAVVLAALAIMIVASFAIWGEADAAGRDSLFDWAAYVAAVGVNVAFYARLYVHMRDVARGHEP